MAVKTWLVRTGVLWLVLLGILVGANEVVGVVAVRDVGWRPGPLSGVADFIWDAFAWLHLTGAVAALLPAYWWQRRGGSGWATPAIAFAMPLSILAVLALLRGTDGDDLFLALALVAVVAISFIGSLLIALFVLPAPDETLAAPCDSR